MTTTNVKVYTTTTCKHCKALKQLLEKEGVGYAEINMASAKAMSELYANNVYTTTAPVLQIQNKFYANIEMPGELMNILKSHDLKVEK